MENWTNLYRELARIIQEKIPQIYWIDLWHNQVNFLQDEHPFQTPAIFLSFTYSMKLLPIPLRELITKNRH